MGALVALRLVQSGMDAAGNVFESAIESIIRWVTDAVVWVISAVFRFFLDTADPNVQADWFVAGDGPYGTTATIGAVLLVGFVLAGIAQGALTGDTGGMVRRVALDLPLSVLGMVGLVTVVQVAVRVTDVLSMWVLRNFEEDLQDFTAVAGTVANLAPGMSTMFVVFVLSVVAVIAGLVLIAELAVRAALIYVVVALAPLVFAARLWPALQGTAKRLLQLLFALILSKLVMAVALAVAASAAVGSGSGGEVTALPEPEVAAEDPDGSMTQAVGILMAAIAAFGVAAFSPLVVVKLLPLTESAMVAQGIKGGPVRAAQQASSMAYSVRYMGGGRLGRIATGHSGVGGPGGGSGPTGGGRGPAAGGTGGAGSGGGAGGGGTAGAVGVAAPTAATTAARAGGDLIRRGAGSMQDVAPTSGTGASGSRSGAPGGPREVWRPVANTGPASSPAEGKEVANQPEGPVPPPDVAVRRRRDPDIGRPEGKGDHGS